MASIEPTEMLKGGPIIVALFVETGTVPVRTRQVTTTALFLTAVKRFYSPIASMTESVPLKQSN